MTDPTVGVNPSLAALSRRPLRSFILLCQIVAVALRRARGVFFLNHLGDGGTGSAALRSELNGSIEEGENRKWSAKKCVALS